MRARVASFLSEPSTSSPGVRVGRGEVLVIVALLALHVALTWAFRTPSVLTGNDQAWYIVLARALRALSYENLQFAAVTPHTKFPPAYPALLSLFGVTSLDRIDVAVALNACLSSAALVLTYAMLRRVDRGVALLVLAIAAVNPSLILVAGSVNSEPLFMASSAVALLVLARRDLSKRAVMLVVGALVAAALSRTIGVTYILAVGLLWIAQRQWRWTVMLGATSLVTVGAWLAWSAIRDETRLAGQSYLADAVYPGADARSKDTPSPAVPGSREAVATFPAVENARRPRGPVSGAVVSGELAFDAIATTPSSGVRVPATAVVADTTVVHAQEAASTAADGPVSLWGILTRRAAKNVRAIAARKVPWTLALPLATASRSAAAVWVVAAGLLALAALPRLVRHLPAFVLATSAYAGLLIVWPYVLERYLVPIVPAALAALLLGALVLGERMGLGARWRYLFPGLVAGALVAFAVKEQVVTWRAVAACDRSRAAESPGCFADFQREFLAAAAVVRALPDDRENFLVSQEPAFHLLTGRYAAREAEAAQLRDPAQLSAYLRAQGVSYVLLSRTNLNQWSLAQPLLELCSRMRVHRTFGPHAALLRLVSEGAPDEAGMPGDARQPDGDACAVLASWAAPPWPQGPPPRW